MPAQLPLDVGVAVGVEDVTGFVVVVEEDFVVVVEGDVVVVGFVVLVGEDDVGIAAPPQALIALQSLFTSPDGVAEADHFACHIYPPYDTWAPPEYVEPAEKAGAEHAGNVKPVPPAPERAFFVAKS